jgi:hypothetical protein
MQGEKLMIESHFPDLRRALSDKKHEPLSPKKMQTAVGMLAGLYEANQMPVRLFAAVAAARAYPDAKRFLLSHGWAAEDVDALPVVQVALMHAVADYDRLMDEMYKWQSLPYWEAAKGMQEAVQQLKNTRVRELEHGGVPLATLLMPAGTYPPGPAPGSFAGSRSGSPACRRSRRQAARRTDRHQGGADPGRSDHGQELRIHAGRRESPAPRTAAARSPGH